MIVNALELVQAAAEPNTSHTDMVSALNALVRTRVRVRGPGVASAWLVRAVPEMRWNSQAWSVVLTWEVNLYADIRVSKLADITVELGEHGAVFSMRNRHKQTGVDDMAATLTVPRMTLETVDADQATAAKAIVAVCKKMLLQYMTAAASAHAAAEARPTHPADVFKQIKPPFPVTERDGFTLRFSTHPTLSGLWYFTAGRKRKSDVLGKVMIAGANVEVRGPERVLGTEVVRIQHTESPVDLFRQIVDAAFKIAKSEGL